METIAERPLRFSLTAMLKDTRHSPMNQYFDWRLPNHRALALDYRAYGQPDLLVDPCEDLQRDPGLIGSSFDLAVKFMLDRNHDPQIARIKARTFEDLIAVNDLILTAQEAPATSEIFTRACWALAHLVHVGRHGLMEGSLIWTLMHEGQFTPDVLLSLASPDNVDQVARLIQIFASDPPFTGARALAPDLSYRCLNADADLVTDAGILVEVKTRLGTKRPDGTRHDAFPKLDIRQLVSYALLDFDDHLGLTGLGVYSGRYGTYMDWELGDALDMMADEPVDLALERATVRTLLDRVANLEIPYLTPTLIGPQLMCPELLFVDVPRDLITELAKAHNCPADAASVSLALSTDLHRRHGMQTPREIADATYGSRVQFTPTPPASPPPTEGTLVSERLILDLSNELYDKLKAEHGGPGMSKKELTRAMRDALYREHGVEPPRDAAQQRMIDAKHRRLAALQAELSALED